MTTTLPADEYQDPAADAIAPPRPAVLIPGDALASTLATLNLLDEFLRLHASTATRAELQHFAGRQGWHPVQGAAVLIDRIGLDVHRLTQARDDSRPEPF